MRSSDSPGRRLLLIVALLLACVAVRQVAASASPGSMLYHADEGPIMPHIGIKAIFWLPPGYHYESPAEDAAYVPNYQSTNPCIGFTPADARYECFLYQFMLDLSDNPYTDIVEQYTQKGGVHPDGLVQYVDHVVDTAPFPASVTANPPSLTRQAVQAEVASVRAAHGWPEDGDTLYLVILPEGVPSDGADNGSYHDLFVDAATGKSVIFSAVGDAFRIAGPFPNGDIPADSAMPVLAHEIFEAITDPDYRRRSTTGLDGKAWTDAEGGEIADKCDLAADQPPRDDIGATLYLHGHPWRLGTMWSNSAGGCASDACGLVVCQPEVTATLASDARVFPDGVVTYELDLHNASATAAAADLLIGGELPDGASYLAGSAAVDRGASAVSIVQTGQHVQIDITHDPEPGVAPNDPLNRTIAVLQTVHVHFSVHVSPLQPATGQATMCLSATWSDRVVTGNTQSDADRAANPPIPSPPAQLLLGYTHGTVPCSTTKIGLQGKATTTTMSAAPDQGSPATVTVSVTGSGPPCIPGATVDAPYGDITVVDDTVGVPLGEGKTPSGTCALDATELSGIYTASLELPVSFPYDPTTIDHDLHADFVSDDPDQWLSSRGDAKHAVPPTPTTIVLTATPDPSGASRFLLHAQVSPAPDGGTVAFTDGDDVLPGCEAVAVTTDGADCSATLLEVGAHMLSATFSGDGAFASARSSVVEQRIESPEVDSADERQHGETDGDEEAAIVAPEPVPGPTARAVLPVTGADDGRAVIVGLPLIGLAVLGRRCARRPL